MKKRLRKKLFFSMLPIFILTLSFFGWDTAHAGPLGSSWNPLNWAGNATYAAFQYLLYALFLFVGLFTSVATTLFAYCVDPQHVSGPNGLLNLQAVYDMWKFVRDIVNIFFILGLLYIAFSFVFQLDGHGNSKAIIKLVIAALVVNFSFPITRVIIDFANVPMYFFLQMILGDGANASAALSSSLGASNLENILLPQGTDSTVTTLLAGIVFLFIFNITLLVFAFQFLIRLIALVILLILSPIGFVANYIPGLKEKGFGNKWWDEFLNYALFGPAAMFMLVLATNFFAAISGPGNQSAIVGQTASGTTSADPGMVGSMVLFFIPITMLWFAMGVSKNFSIAGADIATKYGKDFSKWAGKMVSTKPAKMIGRKVDSKLASGKYTKYASVGAWKNALKHRAEEQKRHDEQPIKLAAAQMHDQLNNYISRATNTLAGVSTLGLNKNLREKMGKNTDHTDHEFAEAQKQANEHSKEVTTISNRSEFLLEELQAAIDNGDKSRVAGITQALAKQNDLNELIQQMGQKYNKGIDPAQLDANGQPIVSSENAAKVLRNIFEAAGEKDEGLMAKQIMAISEQATNAGNFAYGGMVGFKGHGQFKINSEEEMVGWAEAKVKNMETQDRQKKIHPDSLFTRMDVRIPQLDEDGKEIRVNGAVQYEVELNEDGSTKTNEKGETVYKTQGTFGDINGRVAERIISTFTNADVAESKRSRDDMKAAVYNAYQNIGKDGYEKFTELYTAQNDDGTYKNKIFRDYVEEIKKFKEAKPEAQSESDNGNTKANTGRASGSRGFNRERAAQGRSQKAKPKS